MINASTILKGLETLLANGLDSTYVIERSAYVNMDENRTPWVGLYRGPITYDPHTLGRGSNSWRADVQVRVLIQAASLNSAEQAEERLEQYIKEVLDVIMTDKRLNNTVSIIKEIQVDYSYNMSESESLYFQNAEITLTAEVRTQ